MVKRGKSINLFLTDGTPNGITKCSLANWTGVAYKIPRSELNNCKGRPVLQQSGVYFLFGQDDASDENVVYIGQAGVRKNGDGMLSRLLEHKRNPDKDYWTEAIVFTTSDNTFGPTEISYLENKFCIMATTANRYRVKNENEPTSGNITEEKESEMEDFIDYSKIIIGVLGHKLFEPFTAIIKNDESNNENGIIDNILYITRKTKNSSEGLKAIGKQTSDGFVVLKGSIIQKKDSYSIPQAIKRRREEADFDGNGILREDCLFNSPSAAAGFVVGGSANGWVEWKTAEGKTLKMIEEK